MFGYVGNTFYPQKQLDLSPTSVIGVAQRLAGDFGSSRLRIVSAVNEIQGQKISPTNYAEIRGYVDALRKYAGVVYGRVDLDLFNLTTLPSIYDEVGVYVNQLGLNGIWFDHAVVYDSSIGNAEFNSMMQNLTDAYPHLQYILNNAATHRGYVTPLSGDTWQSKAYVSPSVSVGSYSKVNATTIEQLNKVFPGRVLVHFDANAQVRNEPMGLFANAGRKEEVASFTAVWDGGASGGYTTLIPVIGAWTNGRSAYQGTLYNALAKGNYHRGTLSAFVAAAKGKA